MRPRTGEDTGDFLARRQNAINSSLRNPSRAKNQAADDKAFKSQVKASNLAKRGRGRPRKEKKDMTGDLTIFEGGKKPKQKRAPAAVGSGRNRRAEIVKQVMKEKGISMIEASSYVKAHNLYKK